MYSSAHLYIWVSTTRDRRSRNRILTHDYETGYEGMITEPDMDTWCLGSWHGPRNDGVVYVCKLVRLSRTSIRVRQMRQGIHSAMCIHGAYTLGIHEAYTGHTRGIQRRLMDGHGRKENVDRGKRTGVTQGRRRNLVGARDRWSEGRTDWPTETICHVFKDVWSRNGLFKIRGLTRVIIKQTCAGHDNSSRLAWSG